MKTSRTIEVDYLARVEGEGAMYVLIEDGKVEDVRLKIFEPPRFFEAFLREKRFTEAPDITARICGICPVAYQMSAVIAMEDALGLTVTPTIERLRRLLYCGEWIESHVLHVYMLHAPDFLGYESAIHMAKDHGERVATGLRMKKAGNSIVSGVGGREIHPVNVKVGGFYRLPTVAELRALLPELRWGVEAARDTVRWAAGLDFPHLERPYELVSLAHPEVYPMAEGRLVSTAGLDIAAAQFDESIEEIHVPHSNALHARIRDRGAYFTGPMARFALNFDRLPDDIRSLADEVGVGPDCRNPFKSILIRSLEVLYAFEEAVAIVEGWAPKGPAAIEGDVRGDGEIRTGHGITEAPRGILYHRYEIGGDDRITDARIVPPTSQNQETIEDDLRDLVSRNLALNDADLKWRCEQAIRNYDPCISCATHFLDLTVERRS